METIEWHEETDDGEVTYILPAKFDVCPRCEGKGSHVNPNIDGHGITAEEWERDWSDEERETYLTGGYDVPCHQCDGLRVVRVVDRQRCDPELLRRYDAHQEALRQSAAEARYWARLESGDLG